MALVSRQGARPHRGCGQMAGRQLCTGELCSTSRAPARSRTTGRAQRSQASPPCRTLRQAQAGASSTTSRCNTRSMPSRSRHHRHLAQPRCVRHQVRLRAPGAAPRGHHRCLRVAGHDGGRGNAGAVGGHVLPRGHDRARQAVPPRPRHLHRIRAQGTTKVYTGTSSGSPSARAPRPRGTTSTASARPPRAAT